MSIQDILLGVILIGIGVIAWKVFMGSQKKDSSQDQILREMLENVRRDLTSTKDTLYEGMGKNAQNMQERLEKTLDLVNKQLGGMDTRIDKRVEQINHRLDAAAKMMGDVQKQYGNVEQISSSIKQLQEAFKAPKPRGGFGEKALVDLVERVLPVTAYKPQFTFRSGAIVDLLISTTNGNIAVDAKFPLENYLKLVDDPTSEEARRLFRNDVKKHVRDIAKKYILPEEGTLEFALMYVPSDAVMYEILTDEEISQLAESLHVFILSPHSFYYFLNIIRLAYQSQKFEENAKKILGLIRGIKQQNDKLGEEIGVLQKHVGNAHNKMTDVQTSYAQLDMRIGETQRLESNENPTKIESAIEESTLVSATRA